ncbi:TolC family protein [Delftia sp. PS-11]|uniref:TolC family protein n=1 Tax=Delftia sp. PS-11 TaxID=2767222 RepID=UPI002453D386|nr:TolC family protein [Delftia sp. PS-11]KAJ8744948.1 TolC family protein [Delftia sp. PS-11]
MKNSSFMTRKNYFLAGALLASLGAQGASAAEADGKTPLSMEDAIRISLKNASSLILERIKVELAKANETAAAAPFDTSLKASAAIDRVRGYRYPSELQNLPGNLSNAASAMSSYNAGISSLGASVAPAISVPALSTFMADHQDNQEFKSSISKYFRSGIYADLSLSLASSKNAKTNADLQSAIPVLANGIPGFLNPVNPGINASTYGTVHPSTIQMTLNFPMLKGSGEHNLAAANESQKRLQREAAENLVKHAVAGVVQNVITRYWDYKASQTKLQYTKESASQIEAWVAQLEKNVASQSGSKKAPGGESRELSFLKAFLTQTQASVNAAEEAVNVSRNQLANDMGIARDEARKIGDARENYPLDWSHVLASYDDAAMRNRWNALGTENRFDLRAAELQVEGANAIYLGAKNSALPKLDLAVIARRQGLSAGGNNLPQLNSLTTGSGGLGGTVLLSFEYLLDNSAAKGLIGQTYLGKLQEEENLRNAKRTVGLSIDSVVSTVHNALSGLAQSKIQVEQYVSSLNALVKNGNFPVESTFYLVQVEQGRLKSFIDNVNAIQNVANAVAAARFQTGTLTRSVGSSEEIALEDITRLP